MLAEGGLAPGGRGTGGEDISLFIAEMAGSDETGVYTEGRPLAGVLPIRECGIEDMSSLSEEKEE